MGADSPCARRLRSLFACASLFAIFLIAGCAHPISTKALNELEKELWTGRISLHVKSEPEQFFSAGFQLKGSPEQGELQLISPLGSVLGVLRWSPGEVLYDPGNADKVQHYDSVDSLMAQATGAAVPLPALFAWLQGNGAKVDGWSADLSRHGEGRIFATRTQPPPAVDLRVALDR